MNITISFQQLFTHTKCATTNHSSILVLIGETKHSGEKNCRTNNERTYMQKEENVLQKYN